MDSPRIGSLPWLHQWREVPCESLSSSRTESPLLASSLWNRHLEVYRATVLVADLIPRLRIDVLAADEDASELADLLARIGSAHSGGDDTGQVWISAVEDVVRVRTGEHGEPAI